MNTHGYQYKSAIFKETYARGVTEGKIEGKIEALCLFLEVRGFAVTSEVRDRITSCADLALLDEWIARAGDAASIDEVFA